MTQHNLAKQLQTVEKLKRNENYTFVLSFERHCAKILKQF
jgi:hypothetical protein